MLNKYRPDIDGLRALAILPVVFFHVGVPGISGGYVGVDIFFVISGYVIAQSLLSDLREQRFSILGFYERRVRRILPAFLVMAVGCFVAALMELPPPDMADFSTSLASSAAFASNIYFWQHSGYFETGALTRPLLHTWSLSVEEQYYLFVPLALWLSFSYVPRRMFALFAVAAVASLALCIFAIGKAPTASFFLLPTRAWELLLGALLVLKPTHRQLPSAVYDGLGLLGAAFIGISVAAFNDTTPFPGMAALLPTVGAALIIFTGTDRATPVSRLLSWRPFVMIGLVSYSLYLAHWPIIVFTRYVTLKEPDTLQKCAIVLASFALAFLSWRFIERPFRRPGSFAPRRVILIASVLLLASVGAAGGAGIITKGFAARYPDYEDAMAAAHATGGAGQSWKENVCFLQGQTADDWKPDECTRTKGAEGNAILWGDSFAAHYVPGLIANEDRLSRNIVQYTFAGCPPILDYNSYARPGCSGFNRRIFEVVEKFHADTVILSCRWDQVRTRGFDGLGDTVRALRDKGLKVYVIGQSPTFAFSVAYLSLRHAGHRADGSAGWEISADPEINQKVAEAVGDAYVNPLSSLCKDRTCDYMRSGSLLFFDSGHLTQVGSSLAVQTYFPLFTGTSALLGR